MKRNHLPLGLAALVLSATFLHGATPAPQARITLVEHDTAPGSAASADPSIARKALPGLPVQEAHVFGHTIQVGTSVTEIVEVAFHATTSVVTIQATNDFHVVSGGSCQENKVYNAGDICTVDVTFKGMGPGHRAGQLQFATAESAQPEFIGLQGQTFGAAIAFTPALITTLPQSLVNGNPLIYYPGDIAVDQGDNLYFTDQAVGGTTPATGELYFIDGSQNLTKLAGGGTTKLTAANGSGNAWGGADVDLQDPLGITVDPFLNVYVAEAGNNAVDLEQFGNISLYAGLGAGNVSSCITPTDCKALSVALASPVYIKSDSAGNLYFDDDYYYYTIPYATSVEQNQGEQYIEAFLSSSDNGIEQGSSFGLDSSENIYSSRYGNGDTCQVEGWTPATNFQWAVAGSGLCAYAADNVRAQNAEIGDLVDGYTVDAAGDLYFADTVNNVLRRVDNYNGLIRTVAGDYSLGANYTGDGGPATAATLNFPIGVAVDSNGVIYTTSLIAGASLDEETSAKGLPRPASKSATAKPEACSKDCGPPPIAVIRKIGPDGQINFPVTFEGSTSPVSTILLTNVGNDFLTVSDSILGGADPTSFVADPATTSCTFGTTTPMSPGVSCQLGFVCAPKAAGLLTATVTLVDNTATFANVINLSCDALATKVTPTVVVDPPVPSAAYAYQYSVPITVTVGNSLPGPTPPTGTVTLTITDLTTSTVYATVGPLTLSSAEFATTGTVSYTLPSSVNLKAGSYSIVAAYSGDKYDAATSSAADPFTVVPVAPTITWAPPADFTAGTALGAAQLDATTSYWGKVVAGTLAYSVAPSTTTICTSTVTTTAPACTPATAVDLDTVGSVTLTVTFTPTDTVDYKTATKSVSITVVQLTPTITWATPAEVGVGTVLGTTQFDAKAAYGGVTLPGTYAYSVLWNGTTTALCANLDISTACTTPYSISSAQSDETVGLYVLFTPTNNITYTTAWAQVNLAIFIDVNNSKVTGTTLASEKNPVPEGDSVELTTSVTAPSGRATPTGEVTLLEGKTKLATATLSSGVAKITLKGLSAGTHVITAEYTGDKEHKSSASKPLHQIVVTVSDGTARLR